MTDRTIAIAALVVALLAFFLLAVHAVIPTPPAHTANGIYDRYLRMSGGTGPSSATA